MVHERSGLWELSVWRFLGNYVDPVTLVVRILVAGPLNYTLDARVDSVVFA